MTYVTIARRVHVGNVSLSFSHRVRGRLVCACVRMHPCLCLPACMHAYMYLRMLISLRFYARKRSQLVAWLAGWACMHARCMAGTCMYQPAAENILADE